MTSKSPFNMPVWGYLEDGLAQANEEVEELAHLVPADEWKRLDIVVSIIIASHQQLALPKRAPISKDLVAAAQVLGDSMVATRGALSMGPREGPRERSQARGLMSGGDHSFRRSVVGYSAGSRPFARRYAEGTNVVVLDPDVAAAFPDAASVNRALRQLADLPQPRSSS